MSGRWYQDQLYLVLDRAKRRNTLSGMVYDRQSSRVFNTGPILCIEPRTQECLCIILISMFRRSGIVLVGLNDIPCPRVVVSATFTH
jgi:hypothetical protein